MIIEGEKELFEHIKLLEKAYGTLRIEVYDESGDIVYSNEIESKNILTFKPDNMNNKKLRLVKGKS